MRRGPWAQVESVADLSLHSSVGQVASDCGILAVGAVLSCDVPVGALPEGGLMSRAPNFT